ncbi:MAG: hypothetical protein AAFN81_19690 [Bacteroidota bacterium]
MNASQRYHSAIFIIMCLALGHQVLQKGFNVYIPFLHSYLDDILAMPLLLALWRWERNWWWAVSDLRKRELLLFTLVVFCLFELILPKFSSAYTADWNDGLAYSAGSVLFWWCQPKQNPVS